MQEALKTQSAPAKTLGKKVSVIVPVPVETGFTYLAAEDYAPGTFVSVPWGKTTVTGVVEGETQSNIPLSKLKSVFEPLPVPPLQPLHLEFLKWVARYTMSPLGSVLKMTLSEPTIFKAAKKEVFYTLNKNEKDKIHIRYEKIIAYMEEHKKSSRADIVQNTGASLSVLKTLIKKNILVESQEDIEDRYPCTNLTAHSKNVDLTEAQQKALDIINETSGKPVLLDGVTGAGKTEVYFEAVAECLKRGQQALILAPEITLTNAFTDRFEQRFGAAPALWHSDLSHGVRRKTWLGVAHGKTEVIIGARSALFLPYKNLGLIVVDEEHDNSYKQDEGVIYNARDMAIVRAHLANIPIVLVSATPSLETLQNTWDGRYAHAELPARYGAAEMPEVRLIDLRQEKMERQRFIGATLEKALLDTLARGEQSLLFLNRRGYAPLTICKNCGHRLSCPHCTAWLVEHKKSGKTQCHHCGFHAPLPKECPDCQEKDSWRACGPGVERIAEEVSTLFPQARLMTLSSDLIESPKQITEALQKIKNNEVDIIVGTQILAKGHHFPDLTTVGIVDSDIAAAGELRSAEKAFQLLQQVAGRAGRAEKKGIVYAQSFAPETPVLEAFVKGDRDAFFEAELQEREAAFMPPFSRLAAIIVADKDEALLKKLCQELASKAPQSERVTILGPAPAMLYRLRGLYRMRFLIRADKRANINKLIKDWLDCVRIPSRTKVQIDIDPLSFY